MAGRRILILGAGVYQVPLINKAREMALETVVVSAPGGGTRPPWLASATTPTTVQVKLASIGAPGGVKG